MSIHFPKDFLWGAATASYQIEGAAFEGGKGESIWDRFTHIPGNVEGAATGDVACDFYHRYEEDIALMAKLGLRSFRFSISWPRVIPDGDGEVNQEGLDFYIKMVRCLREHGIRPAATLYHWDLPQALQDKGGWANRDIVAAFERYARTVFEALDGEVDLWITLNEPWVTAFAGYFEGRHAPGIRDYPMALRCGHNLLLSHGAAVRAYRDMGGKGQIGITFNMNLCTPATDAPEDKDAVERKLLENIDLFADPVCRGRYPKKLMDFLGARMPLPEIREGDMEIIAADIDFLGLNTYFTESVIHDPSAWPLEGRVVPRGKPRTEMGWEVDPEGMYDLLKLLGERYKMPIYITENGVAVNDWVGPDGTVNDPNRVQYLREYLTQVHRAMADGVDVKGYFVWSLLDNFEWEVGYRPRFGIVYVDYVTQKRIPKNSALWYRDLMQTGEIK